jgi:hypothetical protein
MTTLAQPPAVSADPPQLPPPRVTPEWAAWLEEAAAERGLPPDPWPLP